MMAQQYTYESTPAIKSFTSTGSGTTTGPKINYNGEYYAGGTDTYKNGELKATLYNYATTSSDYLTLAFQLKKDNDGYFVNGNSGKIFVWNESDGSVYLAQTFNITNATTSTINVRVRYDYFTGSRSFSFYLVTSDQVYKQYGGTIKVTCTSSSVPPTISTLDANYITQTSAILNGMVRPNGQSTSYQFSYGTSRSNLSVVSSGTVSGSKSYESVSYNLTGLTAGRTYYFQLTGSNSAGSDEGDILSFQTETQPNNPPSKPTNPSPSNGATDVDTNGTFSWSCSDADGDIIKYNIYLGTSSSNLSFYKSSANTLCGFENLEGGKKYYWRVDPYDNEDTTTGTTWYFTTKSTPSGDDMTMDQAAQYLQNKGVIVSGDPKVDDNILRQDLAKIGFRGAYSIKNRSVPSSVPSDYYPTVYDDIATKTSTNEYYYQAAKALLYLEYGDGVSPFDRNRLNFNPTGTIERIHVLKVLLEAFNIQPKMSGTDYFSGDADVQDLASRDPRKYGYIRSAGDLHIINTSISSWRPYKACTRGEAFLMLARIMQKIDDGTITDPNPGNSDYFEPLNTTLKTIALGTGLQMGNFQHYTKTSFAISGTVPLAFVHTYNSYNTTLPEVFYGAKTVNGVIETYQPMGDGWSHNYHSFITMVDDRAIVHWGGGQIDVYKSNGSKFVPESYGVYDDFSMDGSYAVIKTKSQMEYRFSNQGGSGAVVLYLSTVKDRNGNTLTLNYESGENGSKRISNVSDGIGRKLTFAYKDGTNLVRKVTDPLGRYIEFGYTKNSATEHYQLSGFKDAMQNDTRYYYGDNSKLSTSKLLTKIRLPKGNYIENEYDANCRLNNTVSGVNGVPTTKTSVSVETQYASTKNTLSQVNVSRGSQTSSYNYTYNSDNVLKKMTGEEGLTLNASYNNTLHPELPTSLSSNSTNINSVEYDDRGNVTSITVKANDGSSTLTTSMTYDSMNNLTSVTDPKGNKTTYSYDSNGNLTGVSAPESVTSSITVNSKGLPTTVTNAMGVKTNFEYNSYGNLTKTTLPALSLSSSATYDNASRVISATDALGRTTTFSYNNNDNLISETDPASHTTSYDYDQNDNLTSITNAKGGVTSMSYDNATDWLTSVSFAGATKKYSYNKDGSLDTFTKPDGTTFNYSYDDLGRVTNDGVNSYGYDSKLRLSSVTGDGKTLSYTYDGFNRITGTEYNGHSNSYSYDKNGNCTSVNGTTYGYDKLNRLTSVSFNGKTITYTYRKDSQIEKVSYPNGMTTTYGYDAVGRMTSKKTTLSNGTVVASYTFELDKVGNITKQTTKEPYSNISLTNEDVSYSYNSGNRITKAGDISFSFDENGNTTKRGSEAYQWDKDDRLTRAGSTAITYDPLGLIASYGSTTFTTDPLGIGNVLSDSKSGAEYIYGNGLEARVKSGKVSYYVTDVRGSVVAIVDENNNITHKYQYDEFGKVIQKQEADYNPFQYVGKYGVMYLTDHQYYMRARHYDPTIGRFLSEDPIWSTNLYPYADNNPIMGIDPEGRLMKYSYGSTIGWIGKDGSIHYSSEASTERKERKEKEKIEKKLKEAAQYTYTEVYNNRTQKFESVFYKNGEKKSWVNRWGWLGGIPKDIQDILINNYNSRDLDDRFIQKEFTKSKTDVFVDDYLLQEGSPYDAYGKAAKDCYNNYRECLF